MVGQLGNQVKAANAYERAEYYTFEQAGLNLFQAVSEAWLSVLSVQKELATILAQKETLDTIILDLKERSKIGRNRVTDVYTAEAEVARVKAEIESLKFKKIESETQLKYLTGLDTIPLLDQKNMVTPPEKLSKEWRNNIPDTPALKALRADLEVAEFQKEALKGDFWPQVDLDGNYYLERAGILERSKWSVSIDATWTLWDWGQRGHLVEQKETQREQARLSLENGLRQQRLELQKAIKNYEQKQIELSYYKAAAKLSNKNYVALKNDHDLGLISNIEVLRALHDYYDVERRKDNIEIDLKRAWIHLKILRGERP